MKRLTWNEKWDLLIINPHITVKQIQLLLDVGQPSALELRSKTLKLAEKEGRWVKDRKIPADLLLRTVGLDISYFEKMALEEKKFRVEG